jgi:hypothetical protein
VIAVAHPLSLGAMCEQVQDAVHNSQLEMLRSSDDRAADEATEWCIVEGLMFFETREGGHPHPSLLATEVSRSKTLSATQQFRHQLKTDR